MLFIVVTYQSIAGFPKQQPRSLPFEKAEPPQRFLRPRSIEFAVNCVALIGNLVHKATNKSLIVCRFVMLLAVIDQAWQLNPELQYIGRPHPLSGSPRCAIG